MCRRFINILLVVCIIFCALASSGVFVNARSSEVTEAIAMDALIITDVIMTYENGEVYHQEWTNQRIIISGNVLAADDSEALQVFYCDQEEYETQEPKGTEIIVAKGAFTFSVEQEHKGNYYIWACDNVGNQSEVKTIEINIDTTAPQIVAYNLDVIHAGTTRKVTNILNVGLFSNEAVKVTIRIEDGKISSGLCDIELTYNYLDKDGKSFVLSPTAEIIETEAIFYLPSNRELTASEEIMYNGVLTAVARDNAGNISDMAGPGDVDSRHSNRLMIENIRPVIDENSIKRSPDLHWANEQVTITGCATDLRGSGLSKIRYGSKAEYESDHIPGSKAVLAEEEFSFTVNKEHKGAYYIWAYDNAGNKSKASPVEVNIDRTPPKGKITVGDFNVWDDSIKYSRKKQLVSISATDELSKVREICYYIHPIDIKHSNELYRRSLSEAELKSEEILWTQYEEFAMEPLGAEIRFAIYGRIMDHAGNITYLKTDIIVLDNKEPEISVDYSVMANNDAYQKISLPEEQYQQSAIKAEIVIIERNFSPADTKLKITAADANGDLIEGISPTSESWKTDAKNSDKHTLTLYFTEDANYSLDLTCADLVANQAAPLKGAQFTVDRISPTGTIIVADNKDQGWLWTKLMKIVFELFSSKSLSIRIDSNDEVSGIAGVHYFKSYQEMTIAKLNNLKESDWIKGGSLSVHPDERFVVYARIMDRSGNRTYISTNGVIIDSTASQPKIKIALPEPIHGIYGGDVEVSIDVVEPIVNGTYSGLEEISLKIMTDGIKTKELCLLSNGKGTRQQTFFQTVTIDAAVNNSNDVVVEIYVRDHAGNESELKRALKIDVTVPIIEVTYDQHNALNREYYKDTRTATIVIHERNFNEADVVFNITNSEGIIPTISSWTHGQAFTHTAFVVFTADGDYTFTLSYADLAGNKAKYTTVDQFTIDKIAPQIMVTYDNDNSQNEYYYHKTRTATIHIDEHNFNPTDVNVKMTAVDSGSIISPPTVGNFSSSQDVRTAQITFSEDGEYTLEIEYTDMAGNSAKTYEEEYFIVDTTAPKIQIFGVADMSANNGVVAPIIECSDINYDAESLTITLSGYNNGDIKPLFTTSGIQNGEKVMLHDFAYHKACDDLYTLTATVEDKAGNKEETEIRFSVNRFGSVYILGDTTQMLVNNYYTNKEIPLVITEINVDTLEFIDVAYAKDGKLSILKAESDFDLKTSGSEASWKSYVYTVYEDNFKGDGNYSVTFYSEDGATNASNNKVKDEAIEFVVDKTPPTIVLSAVENAKQYQADRVTAMIDAKDNIYLKNVDVYLDNICVKTFSGEDVERNNGILKFEIPSADSWQRLKVTAFDAAGNESIAKEASILVTTNLWIQFYQNKPLFTAALTVVGLGVGGTGSFFFLLKKKKRNGEYS